MAAAIGRAPGQVPASDPYETIKIPKLPDLSRYPQELQVFREQCAAGVRQAVAMVTAMEHQLWWERSRRQQAEDDIKVLLAAIDTERVLSDGAMSDMQGALAQAQAEVRGDAVVLRADQLPNASKAAMVIQKNFRGHQARKEFEGHLKEILRGVDPELDPSTLPTSAQHHISNVNVKGGAHNKGMKASMQGMKLSNPNIIPGDVATQSLRQEVDTIKKRMQGLPDAGYDGSNAALDPGLDVKRILQGSLPASSAAVVAALVRRCKELQAALVEACESLQESRMAEQGLRAQNMKVVDMSQMRHQLEAERTGRLALQHMVNKLRHALIAQQGGQDTAKEHAHVAAWYRQQYRDGDWINFKPGKGSIAGGKYVFAGPEAEVELWEDLRPGMPEPIYVPKDTNRQYGDLLALQQEMANTAQRDFPDPLYGYPVPDTSQFSYPRDTPIVPMSTPFPLIRESGMSAGGDMYASGYTGHSQSLQPGAMAPMVPMYSVLPLIQENSYMAKQPDNSFSFAPPPPVPTMPYATAPPVAPAPTIQMPPMPARPPSPPRAPMYASEEPYRSEAPVAQHSQGSFNYVRDTPRVTVNSVYPLLREGGTLDGPKQSEFSFGRPGSPSPPQMEIITPLPLIREGGQSPPRMSQGASPLQLIRESWQQQQAAPASGGPGGVWSSSPQPGGPKY